jgi:dephospho-CoA kinase
MNLEIWMADYVIDNNGTLEDLHRNTIDLANHRLRSQR